jgi:hypothetical protein
METPDPKRKNRSKIIGLTTGLRLAHPAVGDDAGQEERLVNKLYVTKLALGGAILGLAVVNWVVGYFGLHWFSDSQVTQDLVGAGAGSALSWLLLKLIHAV